MVVYFHSLLVTVFVPSDTFSWVPLVETERFWAVVGAIDVVEVVTVVDMLLEVAGEPDAQLISEVNTTLTASLFTNVVGVYVLLLDPTLTPFNFH